MPALRAALTDAGFAGVRTHLQSGNIVLDAKLDAPAVATRIEQLIADRFGGLSIPIVTRTREELAGVIAANPLVAYATDPKLHQVTFLSEPLSQARAQELHDLAAPSERLAVAGREIYAWHPEGIARSKLANALAGKLGVVATARNWTTVNAIMELADTNAT
jgi:uncharacterized protein (DUF1697 family)